MYLVMHATATLSTTDRACAAMAASYLAGPCLLAAWLLNAPVVALGALLAALVYRVECRRRMPAAPTRIDFVRPQPTEIKKDAKGRWRCAKTGRFVSKAKADMIIRRSLMG